MQMEGSEAAYLFSRRGLKIYFDIFLSFFFFFGEIMNKSFVNSKMYFILCL